MKSLVKSVLLLLAISKVLTLTLASFEANRPPIHYHFWFKLKCRQTFKCNSEVLHFYQEVYQCLSIITPIMKS